MGNLNFRILSFFLRRMKSNVMIKRMLREVGISSGQTVLDYACGPGLFTIEAAKMVGSNGRVYATDLQPLAKKYIEKGARETGLSNISIFITNGKLDIPDATVDVALLFDVIHYLKNRNEVFHEIHRVLKVGGFLAVDVHHIDSETAIKRVTESQLFKLASQKEVHEKHAAQLLFFSKYFQLSHFLEKYKVS
ncbi:MAG: SAM-dependent methyltransferase [Promethearchaeota archaeon CR_4]|nr:MAG: SAM-dependent methyltransferase [Candidatus Lokiarchaeota archaeon CR_4]